MIRKATQHDFATLVKMAQHIKIDYITPQHIQNDIFSKNLYVVIDKNNNIVAFGARVFDAHFQEYCIKRICVPNAHNRGKGYAQEIIKYLTVTRDRTLFVLRGWITTRCGICQKILVLNSIMFSIQTGAYIQQNGINPFYFMLIALSG